MPRVKPVVEDPESDKNRLVVLSEKIQNPGMPRTLPGIKLFFLLVRCLSIVNLFLRTVKMTPTSF
jgi:hypothetical protein